MAEPTTGFQAAGTAALGPREPPFGLPTPGEGAFVAPRAPGFAHKPGVAPAFDVYQGVFERGRVWGNVHGPQIIFCGGARGLTQDVLADVHGVAPAFAQPTSCPGVCAALGEAGTERAARGDRDGAMASLRDPAQVNANSRREEGVRVLVCGGRDYENAEALHQFAGCATSRRRSSQAPPRPCATRWRRICTARASACPVRCGWSVARLPERAPPLTDLLQCMSALVARFCPMPNGR
jgi:hypothetical protein